MVVSVAIPNVIENGGRAMAPIRKAAFTRPFHLGPGHSRTMPANSAPVRARTSAMRLGVGAS